MNPTSPYRTPTLRRPRTASEVAAWTADLREFGYNATDWLHELQKVHSRPELARRLAEAPRRLRGVFAGGDICDATLAAQAECMCLDAEIPVPGWILDTPPADRAWFENAESKIARTDALLRAPAPFRNRNIFYVPWVKFTAGKGRPKKTPEEIASSNATRQKRYRAKLLREAGRSPRASRRSPAH